MLTEAYYQAEELPWLKLLHLLCHQSVL